MVKRFHKPHEGGFGLVELLVAMGLSLLLLAGVATMFVSSKGSYETNDRLARLEENGRFALDNIARDIRAAGYAGCTNLAIPYIAVHNTNNFLSPNDPTLAANQYPTLDSGIVINPPAEGFNYVSPGTWSPALPGYVPTPADGSDVLVLRGPKAGVAPIELVADMPINDDTAPLYVAPVASGSGFFKNNQLLMIGDCAHRAYFEITNYTPTTGKIEHTVAAATSSSNGNWTPSLGAVFKQRTTDNQPAKDRTGGGAQIYTSQVTAYYVALSTASATESVAAKRYNSLWRQIDSNSPEELIEGVDSMQLLYGLDTNGDGTPDSYSSVANTPSQIVSITVALLVRSLDEYGTLTDSTTYDLLGTSVTSDMFTAPSDRRQRQVFTTTVAVRNPQ